MLENSTKKFLNFWSSDIVAGAWVNEDGHWHQSCFQLEIRKYELKMKSGYYKSINRVPISKNCWRFGFKPFCNKPKAVRYLTNFALKLYIKAILMKPDFHEPQWDCPTQKSCLISASTVNREYFWYIIWRHVVFVYE